MSCRPKPLALRRAHATKDLEYGRASRRVVRILGMSRRAQRLLFHGRTRLEAFALLKATLDEAESSRTKAVAA